ncbi:MAG: SDR family oxidoreductase [Spongiibacteraceae bacterium]
MGALEAMPVMLIAGGSGSIGSELAAQAVAKGWRVAVHGRREARVDSVCAAIRERFSQAIISAHCADFADGETIASLVAEVGEAHQRIDAIVDCSTGGPRGITGLFAETDPAVFADFAAQSVVVLQRLAHAGLPWLRKTRGSLLAVVSDAGIYPAPRQALIGAMRAASIGFIRNLASELAAEGIRANAISPSFVEDTAIVARLDAANPSRLEKARQRAGLGLPNRSDVARLALFLSSADAARITGQIISINGGLNN